MNLRRLFAVSVGCLVVVLAAPSLRTGVAAAAENKVTPGEFVVEPATLINLGFEWFIAGDDNRNASVEVRYRKKGEAQWKKALPLVRLQHEEIYQANQQGPQLNVVSPNMFAGSILDLEADTEYECSFDLSDPDGGSKGNAKAALERLAKADKAEK